MEYFDGRIPGNTAKLSAIILLSAFGPACDQVDEHYDKENVLTRSQRGVLEDIYNHTDWESISDSVPGKTNTYQLIIAYFFMKPMDLLLISETFFEGKNMFFNLAQAICSCASYCETWKEEMVTDVLNAMFQIPTIWNRENIAGFLLFCSENLILHYVGELMESEEEKDIKKAAVLVSDMVIMSFRFENQLNSEKGLGKVLEKICRFGDGNLRLRFFDQIWKAVQEHFAVAEANDDVEEGLEILQCFGTFMMGQLLKDDKDSQPKESSENIQKDEDDMDVDPVSDEHVSENLLLVVF